VDRGFADHTEVGVELGTVDDVFFVGKFFVAVFGTESTLFFPGGAGQFGRFLPFETLDAVPAFEFHGGSGGRHLFFGVRVFWGAVVSYGVVFAPARGSSDLGLDWRRGSVSLPGEWVVCANFNALSFKIIKIKLNYFE
jgi:hypothetical protein